MFARARSAFCLSRIVAFAGALVAGALAPAAAQGGRWVFEGATRLSPTQATLDAVKAPPGHIFQKRISGAFQAGKEAFGTIELFFTDTDADKAVYLGACTVTFRIEGDLHSGRPATYPVVGTLSSEGNGKSKAAGGKCSGAISVDNADYGAVIPDTGLGAQASAKGAIVVPKGSPGATMQIHVAGRLGHGHGAHNGTLSATLRWVAE